jgi:DNA-binding response OmpR family regulator
MHELILVVDDEPMIVDQARAYLEHGGFRVLTAADGQSALALALTAQPDLLVLDLNLPQLDGLDVCRTLRRTSDIPIIMLTARADEIDRLIGLELGADDYIVKPFSPRELVARVRVILRRTGNRLPGGSLPGGSLSGDRLLGGDRLPPTLLRAADLEIDLAGHRVTRRGAEITLSRTEFNLLALLAQHPGQTFTRAQLIDRLHHVAFDGVDRSIDAHVKNLRRKLEPEPGTPRYVLTVFGVGYKFAGTP